MASLTAPQAVLLVIAFCAVYGLLDRAAFRRWFRRIAQQRPAVVPTNLNALFRPPLLRIALVAQVWAEVGCLLALVLVMVTTSALRSTDAGASYYISFSVFGGGCGVVGSSALLIAFDVWGLMVSHQSARREQAAGAHPDEASPPL